MANDSKEKIVNVDGKEIKVHMEPAAFAKGFDKLNTNKSNKPKEKEGLTTNKKKKELHWIPLF
ncbi:MAG: hypothetical protein HDS11_04260 [Bacteroides sp.]|nr:hypothetical protein [Bacteroides sp.]